MNSPERLSPCLVPTGSVALSVEYTPFLKELPAGEGPQITMA